MKLKIDKMRIWFDISNSPHVILFYDLIKDLEQSGHEVLITTRPLANTIDLLDQKSLHYHIVGKHYGKNLFKKILGFPIRVWQLCNLLYQKDIDIAVGQSSFHLPVVARLLNVKSLYTNDNEHAAGNIIAFYFANKILLPDNFILNKYLNTNWIKTKTIFYPGVKEGIYLWVKHQDLTLKRKHSLTGMANIFIRPEPQTAEYYTGALYFLDDIILQLQGKYKVTILTRNQDQYKHYTQSNFNLCYVPSKPLSFDEIAIDCTLFIGAGGSMTREFALLGIPTISVYQDKLLAVDKLLVQYDLLKHIPELNITQVSDALAKMDINTKTNALLAMGRQAYGILRSEILVADKN
jgi:predicted glycosyltransferase